MKYLDLVFGSHRLAPRGPISNARRTGQGKDVPFVLAQLLHREEGGLLDVAVLGLGLYEALGLRQHLRAQVPPARLCYTGGMERMGNPAVDTGERFSYRHYRTWPDEEAWELIEGQAWVMSPAPSVVLQSLLPPRYPATGPRAGAR